MDKQADKQEGISYEEKLALMDIEKAKIKDIFLMKKPYFLVLTNCALMNGAFYTLNGNLNIFLQQRFNQSNTQAGTSMLAVYLTIAGLAPVNGYMFDRFGRRAQSLLGALFIFLLACVFMLYLPGTLYVKGSHTSFNPIILLPLVTLGCFFCVQTAAVWPCVPLTVTPNLYGSAFGLVDSVLQGSIGLLSLFWGLIQDSTMQNMLGYFYPVIFMIILVFLAYGPTLYLNYLDDKNERVLNFPSSKLKVSFRDRLSSLRRSCHH